MANQQGQAFDDLRNTLHECGRILRARWRLAVVGLCVVGAVAFWYSQYLPREYVAATLFERRDDAVLQNLVQTNSPYGFGHLKTTLALDMVGSRALARGAVRAGLLEAADFPGTGALSETERSKLDALLGRYDLAPNVRLLQSSQSLDTISLTCTANDPTVAREFVTALRDGYIEESRQRIQEILASTRAFFEAEVQRLHNELNQAEQHLRSVFGEFAGVADPTDIAALGTRLETMRAHRDTIFQRKTELDAQMAARETFLASVPTFLASERGVQEGGSAAVPAPPPPLDPALEASIRTVKSQLIELVTTRGMTTEHPDVRRLFAKLEALEGLRQALAALSPVILDTTPAPVAGIEPTKAELEWRTQRMRVEMELDALRRQLAITTAQWQETNERTERFAALYEQLSADTETLRLVREKRGGSASELGVWQGHLTYLERVLTAESGERGTQFTLIEEPKDVTRPTRPRVATIFAVCTGLGLAAAALLVALAELFDRSFRSVSQVTRVLGVPVLECIGVIPTPREQCRALRARLLWTPALAVLIGALLLSAGLAYTAVERPALHQRTMERVGGLLGPLGAAVVLPLPR